MSDVKPTDPPTTPAGPDRFRLDGKSVLISGAGGAFGRSAMRGFARAGARVFGIDVNAASLEETRRLVVDDGGTAVVAIADVGDPDAVARAFDALDAAFGGIDVLINNAGINPQQAEPENYPLDVWQRVVQVNLTSVLLMSQQAARRMIAAGRGGSIVNVSSISGARVLGRGNMGFGVSKAGVEQLTRELAVEWAHHGIRVNAIEPCQFINEGLQSLIDNPGKAPLVERMISGIPIGRMGVPDEIVGPMLFLASPAASMVTGAILPVDGGNLAFDAGGSLPTFAGLPSWRS